MVLRSPFLSALALVFCQSATAQDFSYANIAVETVTFSSDLLIREDNATPYGTPQWEKGASQQTPVAYVSGDIPVVSAVLSLECDYAPDSITVRGVGPDGILFPALKVEVGSPSSGAFQINYPTTMAGSGFTAGEVDYFDPFKIGWDISFDDGGNWKATDTSENKLYVTLNNPMNETSNFKYWHTIFEVSCRNADGATTESDAIAGIWSEFTDQVLLDWEGDSLKYYSPMYTFNTNLQSLLNFHNAQCYTFAQFFLSCIKIQGIFRTGNYVYITPVGNSVCGNSVNRFLVADWEFISPSAVGECAAFPYKNTYISLYVPPYTEYNFITEDVEDQIGVPGQCSANPSSFFNNHQIAFIDGTYYDACYGLTFDSVSDIPYDAFSGWGYRYTVGSVKHCLFSDDLDDSWLINIVNTF